MRILARTTGRSAAVLIGAVLMAASTALPAGAVGNSPDKDSIVAGPNCDGGARFSWSSSIYPNNTHGDYAGYNPYNVSQSGDLCNTTSEYVWTDQNNVDTTWLWYEGTASGDGSVAGRDCYVWLYIPTQDAGAPSARYDVWATDDYGLSEVNPPAGWHWLFWPGHNVDQNTTSGWIYIGQHTMGNYPDVVVTLTNKDTANWKIGAGSVAFHCI